MDAIQKKSLYQTLYRGIKESWWVFLLLGITAAFYFYGMHEKSIAYQEHQSRLLQLEKEKQVALQVQDELLLQIKSQSDPEWIEMMLKKDLGMVPEGQVKVYFKKPE